MLPNSAASKLVASSGLSNLADGVLMVLVPVVTFNSTGSPSAVAVVATVGRLPWLLFALPGGVIVDRVDRHLVLITASAGRASVLAILAIVIAVGDSPLWFTCVSLFSLGTAEVLFDTAAQTVVPSVVEGHDQLHATNSALQAVELSVNLFVGPALGGLLAAESPAIGVAVASALYAGALVFVAVLRLRSSSTASVKEPIGWLAVIEGARFIARQRLMRSMVTAVGMSNMAASAMLSLLPAIALGSASTHPASSYALLLMSMAGGALVGTAVAGSFRRRLGLRRTLILSSLGTPILCLSPVVFSRTSLIAAGFVVAGIVTASWNIIAVTIRQQLTPERLLGRVTATSRLVAWGAMPVGSSIAAALVQVQPIPFVLIETAVVGAIGTAIVILGTSSAQFEPVHTNTDPEKEAR